MAQYRQRWTEQATDLVKDVAVVGLGFTATGFTGRYVEERIKPGVSVTDTSTDKIIAWTANTVPKIGIYVVSKMLKADILQDIGKAAAGNIAFDSLVRLSSGGVNPYNIGYGSYRFMGDKVTEQKLLQENQLLRTELDKALAMYSPTQYGRSARQRRYGAMPFNPYDIQREQRFGSMPFSNPTVLERQRRYGSMPTSPAVAERQRKYGSMPAFRNPTQATRQRRFGAMPELPYPVDRPDFGYIAEVPPQMVDSPDFSSMPVNPAVYDGPVSRWTPAPGVRRQYGFSASLDSDGTSGTMFGML